MIRTEDETRERKCLAERDATYAAQFVGIIYKGHAVQDTE
jgi:hypothetical protein